MIDIKKIKHEIEKLPESDFAELRRWIAEKAWEKWDNEIENDSNSNKLDFLIDEAKNEKEDGNLNDL
jgi:hypothetical protein